MKLAAYAMLAITACATTGYFITRSPADKSTETSQANAKRGPRRVVNLKHAPTKPLPTRSWELGVERSYEFKSTRTVTIAKKDAKNVSGALSMSGTLVMTPIADDGDTIHVHTQLVDARFRAHKSADKPVALDTEFIVTYKQDGTLAAVLYPKTVAARTKNELTWMVATLQMASTDSDMAGQWRSIEIDTTGTYAANYRRGDSEPRAVVKSKERYTKLLDGGTTDDYGVSSDNVFDLGDDGWATTITIREQATAATEKLDLKVVTVASATLTGTANRSDRVNNASALFATMISDDLRATTSDKDSQKNHDRQIARGRTVADIIRALLDSKTTREARVNLMLAGAAALRLNSEGVPQIAAEARRLGGSEVSANLLGALGASGLGTAQTSLGNMLNDAELDDGLRVAATISLAQSKQHTDEAVNLLKKAAMGSDTSVKSTAMLALGMVANRNDSQSGLVAELVTKYAAATTIEERASIIGALGNSADAAAMTVLEPAMVDVNAIIRKEAAAALRFMPAGSADQLLVVALTTDGDSNVRQGALLAIGYRTFATYAAALNVVAKVEGNATLRRALVSLLAKQIAQTGARDILTYMANNDADTNVRAAATSALSS